MPTPIPTPAASDSTGLADSVWITDVRDAAKDYPEYVASTWTADGVNGTVGPNATPLKLDKRPIYDASPTTVTVRNNTAGINYTVITTGSPSTNQVLVNYATGEFQFNPVPAASAAIQISYQFCRWRDSTILTALYAGLREMFPAVGKNYTDTSIAIQVNQWDYTLPVWCQDPRSRIVSIEVQDPYIQIEPFRQLSGGYNRVDLTTIHIPRAQLYSPVARLRVVGWGPYLTLGDLEPQLYHLPVWYALGTLLPKAEAFRVRSDQAVPLAAEGGAAVGAQIQTGDYYMTRFREALKALARTPTGWNLQMRTKYQKARHF